MSVYNIPQSMRERRQWMVASEEKRPMRRGWESEHHIVYGEKNNPNHWMSFEEAIELGGNNGLRIGYCNTEDDGLTIIDLDNLQNRNPAKKPHDDETLASQDYILQLAMTNGWYIECSQSGFGAHIVVSGKLSRDTNCGGVEFYGHGGFVVMTGIHAQGQPLALSFENVASFEGLIGAKGGPDNELRYSPEFIERLNAPFNDMERQEYLQHWQKVFKFNPRYIELEKGSDLDAVGNALDGKGNERDFDLLQGIYKVLKGWPERELTALRMFAYSDRWHIRKRKKHQQYLLKETFPKCLEICQREEAQQDSLRGAADAFKLATLNNARPMAQSAAVNMGSMQRSAPPMLNVQPTPQFEFQKPNAILAEPALEWALENVFQKESVNAIYGWSGVGKSFIALDLMMAVAEGRDWFDHETMQMDVTYLALEGGDGMRNRLHAYRINRGADYQLPTNFDIYRGNFNLCDSNQVVAMVEQRKAAGLIGGMFVIDTFAKSIPGADENSARDMGPAIAKAEYIRQELKACVVIIHHSTKPDPKTGIAGGLRGSGTIQAGIEGVIQVSKRDRWSEEEDGIMPELLERKRFLLMDKVKEGADGGVLPFELEVVKIGERVRKTGEVVDITSCAIVDLNAKRYEVNSPIAPIAASEPTYDYGAANRSNGMTRPQSSGKSVKNGRGRSRANEDEWTGTMQPQQAIIQAIIDASIAGKCAGKYGGPGTHCAPETEVMRLALNHYGNPIASEGRKTLVKAIKALSSTGKIGQEMETGKIQWYYLKSGENT